MARAMKMGTTMPKGGHTIHSSVRFAHGAIKPTFSSLYNYEYGVRPKNVNQRDGKKETHDLECGHSIGISGVSSASVIMLYRWF